MRILLIDNYDSFTYNLVQQVRKFGAEVTVQRNDETLPNLTDFDVLMVSPGPGRPEGSGVSIDAIRQATGRMPVLGVCLGLQCFAQVFGGAKVVHAPNLLHGKTSEIFHEGKGLMVGLDHQFHAARYHSLVLNRVPNECELMCWTEEKGKRTIMGVMHRALPVFGVQFHPESFLTEQGDRIMKNFLELISSRSR